MNINKSIIMFVVKPGLGIIGLRAEKKYQVFLRENSFETLTNNFG